MGKYISFIWLNHGIHGSFLMFYLFLVRCQNELLRTRFFFLKTCSYGICLFWTKLNRNTDQTSYVTLLEIFFDLCTFLGVVILL